MNRIEIYGKITGKLEKGKHPDGTPVINFIVLSPGTKRENRFRIYASGKRAELLEEQAYEGAKVHVTGEVKTGSRKVSGALVTINGKEQTLYLPRFDIRAIEIDFE